jgi:hypothetical protein
MIHVAQIGLAGIFMMSAVAMGGQNDTTCFDATAAGERTMINRPH